MNLLTVLTNIFTALIEVGDGLKYIGAGLAVFTGFAAAIGEGNVAAHAVDAMARQPEMAGQIRTTLILGGALAEATAIYGLIGCILIIILVK